jgi:competence protein ComEA
MLCVAASAQTKLPEGAGRATVERVCSKCHKLEQIVREGRSEEQWGEVIESMLTLGAQGTEQELEQIFQYLVRNFPRKDRKININKAGAAEIAAALAVPEADAAAIVSFRVKNGAYTSIEDLKKVPRIDWARIEQRQETLEF